MCFIWRSFYLIDISVFSQELSFCYFFDRLYPLKYGETAGLPPVSLANWEAEVRRICV
jgi:hypothetical protein